MPSEIDPIFSKRELFAYWTRVVFMVVVPGFGAVVSFDTADWTWFARSGSVMVALAVLYFGLAYTSDIKVAAHGLKPNEVMLKIIRRELRIEEGNFEQITLDDLVTEVEKDVKRSKEAIRQVHVSMKYYMLALYGAVAGTFIWGFGDLVGLMLK